jgi:hypothetical protein
VSSLILPTLPKAAYWGNAAAGRQSQLPRILTRAPPSRIAVLHEMPSKPLGELVPLIYNRLKATA